MQGDFLPLWIEASAALIVLALLSYVQFRHVALAILVTLAPLPPAAVAIAFRISFDSTSYLFGFLSAAILASGIVARICDGGLARTATRETLRSAWPLLVWPAVIAIALGGLIAVFSGELTILLVGGFAAAGVVSAGTFVFLAGGILPYGESFITRANRLRERRERWLDALAFIVQSRWSWSISGIGLVFSILGLFRDGSNALPWAAPMLLNLSAAEVSITFGGFLATRRLRPAIAFATAGAVLICLSAWMKVPAASSSSLALAAALPLTVAIRSARFAGRGDNMAVAILRSLERDAVTIILFSIQSSIVLCLFGQFRAAILLASGLPIALLMFPALMTLTQKLLPARVSLEAYRVR